MCAFSAYLNVMQAYAMLANMPPISGLYTAAIAPAFYAVLGTSKHLQIGPASLISLYLPTAMEICGIPPMLYPKNPELEAHWKAERLSLAPVLAFWIGLMYIILSVTRAGNLIKYISHSVMTGFTSAAGLYIGISQLKTIFGIRLEGEFEYNYQLFAYYGGHGIKEGSKITQRMGGLAFLFMYLEKFLKRIFPPTPERMANKYYKAYKYISTFTTIFVVIITAGITRGLYSRGIKIPIVGALPAGYAPVHKPNFAKWPVGAAIPAALPLAVFGFMESYSVGRKYALQFKYDFFPDQELFAIGVGNVFGSFFSSYPSSGNFGRTALAAVIGQRSPMANFIVAAFISLVMVSLLPALYYIPFATLGAIVCNAVVNLVDWPAIIKAFFLSKLDCLVMLVTFLTTLFISISDGLGMGLIASIMCLFWKLSQVGTQRLGRQPDDKQFVPIRVYTAAMEDPQIKVLRMSGRMVFMNAAQIRDHLFRLLEDEHKHYKDIVFDCGGVMSIDLTAILALTDVLLEAEKRSMLLYFANVGKELKSNLLMCDLINRLGGEAVCVRTVEEVYEHAKATREELTKNPPPRRVVANNHH